MNDRIDPALFLVLGGLLAYLPVKLTVRQILEKLDESHRVAAEVKAVAERANKNSVIVNDRYLKLETRVSELEKRGPAGGPQ